MAASDVTEMNLWQLPPRIWVTSAATAAAAAAAAAVAVPAHVFGIQRNSSVFAVQCNVSVIVHCTCGPGLTLTTQQLPLVFTKEA